MISHLWFTVNFPSKYRSYDRGWLADKLKETNHTSKRNLPCTLWEGLDLGKHCFKVRPVRKFARHSQIFFGIAVQCKHGNAYRAIAWEWQNDPELFTDGPQKVSRLIAHLLDNIKFYYIFSVPTKLLFSSLLGGSKSHLGGSDPPNTPVIQTMYVTIYLSIYLLIYLCMHVCMYLSTCFSSGNLNDFFFFFSHD
ncbi:hypothetical protein AALO_G00299160 [Alosa alosa]|uniref:Uncharacterized protein n=1 Tax=Alosa alosa TaxID=278164 RepID=A0AAV6FL26_9TELE|nr:hypothetical protein AALO_G00299160 [Alosa alosa]